MDATIPPCLSGREHPRSNACGDEFLTRPLSPPDRREMRTARDSTSLQGMHQTSSQESE